MTISSKEQETKKVKVTVDKNPVPTSFEKWGATRRRYYLPLERQKF